MIAKENGYNAFAATVLRENASMLRVFKNRYPSAQLTILERQRGDGSHGLRRRHRTPLKGRPEADLRHACDLA